MMPEGEAGDATPNEQLLMLSRDLDLPFDEDESNWDNVTTIEHLACKIFRLASFCATRPDRRSEFWHIIGRHDLAEAVAADLAAMGIEVRASAY